MISESEIAIEGQSGETAQETTGTSQTLKDARAAAELQCIRNALAKANGNVSMAARLLDVDRKWLTKLMKLHDISLGR